MHPLLALAMCIGAGSVVWYELVKLIKHLNKNKERGIRMSFFSRSSKRNHYKYGHQGSGHYKRKGLVENLMDMVISRSHSHGYYENQYNGNTFNQPIQNIQHVKCNKCGSLVPEGSKFCLECGETVIGSTFCLSCGQKFPAGAKFCNNCGSKV